MAEDELLPEFIAEGLELIEKSNLALDQLLTAENREAHLDAIFRNIHTIKGGSGMFGFNNLKTVAHDLETYTRNLKGNLLSITQKEVHYLREEMKRIAELLRNKDQNEVGQAEESETPLTEEFIRVPVSRLNETMNGISEVFLVRNQMVYLVEKFKENAQDKREFLQNWELLDSAIRRGIGELEQTAMGMRLMTIQGLFTRLGRMLESYQIDSKKKITLVTEGENTELDKKVLDSLSEPLIHLIRNSMDHGIETSEDRRAKGKSDTGTIRLKAIISGNEVLIEVSDDGRGIDSQKILSVAKAKGLDVSHVKDAASAVELIFLPGFSTAEKVSDISGRGIGMDVVQNSITSLGGRIQIQTEVNKGTTFSIRIPVSMSLVSVVIVNIGGFPYAVPSHDILEARQFQFDQIKKNGDNDYFSYRNGFIPCVDLRTAIPTVKTDHEENAREVATIFFKINSQIFAGRVTAFDKNTEIVVKPLPKFAPKIPYISGVAVLPTGESIFVLSLSRLHQHISSEAINASSRK